MSSLVCSSVDRVFDIRLSVLGSSCVSHEEAWLVDGLHRLCVATQRVLHGCGPVRVAVDLVLSLLIVSERLILLRCIEPARFSLCNLVCLFKFLSEALLNARVFQELVNGRALVRLGLEHHLDQILNVLDDVAGHWAVLSLIDGPHKMHRVSLEWQFQGSDVVERHSK